MTDLRQAAQQALEALEHCCFSDALVTDKDVAADAIYTLRTALAQQAEPVAWMTINSYGEEDDIHYENPEGHLLEGWTFKPLYTHPPTAQPEQEPISMRLPKAGDRVICLEDESLGTVESLTAGGSPDIVFDDGSRGTYMLREFAELFGYVAPPQHQWVGLTDEDCKRMSAGDKLVAMWAEAKLKERNT